MCIMTLVTKEDVVRFRKIIINVHDQIIAISGGLSGVRDEGGLDHALFSCLTSLEKHPEKTFENAAEAYRMFATRHYFNDGNKRTAHVFAKLYLLTYDIRLKLDYKDAVQFIIDIASNKKPIDEIAQWLEGNSTKINSLTHYLDDLAGAIEEIRKYMESQN